MNHIGRLLLLAAVLVSALAVVQIKHDNRRLVSELEQARGEQRKLQVEWAQLQLEEATLAHHGRIEKAARDKLGMAEPERVEVLGVTP